MYSYIFTDNTVTNNEYGITVHLPERFEKEQDRAFTEAIMLVLMEREERKYLDECRIKCDNERAQQEVLELSYDERFQEELPGEWELVVESELSYITIGDCYSDNCDCQKHTCCPHSWCKTCVREAIEERRKLHNGPIYVSFGYHEEYEASMVSGRKSWELGRLFV